MTSITKSVDTLIVEQPAASCDADLAKGPWEFDTFPGYGPGSSMGDIIPVGSPRQGALPL